MTSRLAEKIALYSVKTRFCDLAKLWMEEEKGVGKGGKKRNRFFHDEADESDGDDVEGIGRKKKGKAESDIEDNDDNEYQEDGFVVADNSDDEDELEHRGEENSNDDEQQDGDSGCPRFRAHNGCADRVLRAEIGIVGDGCHDPEHESQ